MKVLLDTCVSVKAAEALRSHGHDVVWAGDWEVDPGDDAILALAHDDGRILVTLDKDFGELAVALKRPHAGIVRLVGLRSGEQGPTALAVIERYEKELGRGALVTVQAGRIRVRVAGT